MSWEAIAIYGNALSEYARQPIIYLAWGAFLTFVVGEGLKDRLLTRRAKRGFSLRVVKLAWNRIYWSQAFLGRTSSYNVGEHCQSDIDSAWQHLTESVAEWNTHLMGNLQLFQEYYPRFQMMQLGWTSIVTFLRRFRGVSRNSLRFRAYQAIFKYTFPLRVEFEELIQPRFASIQSSLFDIRYRNKNTQKDRDNIHRDLEAFKKVIGLFVEQLEVEYQDR